MDDSPADAVPPPAAPLLAGCWLGTVVPKRHARRAVTRNLLKRQMRAIAQVESGRLPPGLWVVRLKAPFDKQQFTSAASVPLRASARTELATLFQRAIAGPARAPAPSLRPAAR